MTVAGLRVRLLPMPLLLRPSALLLGLFQLQLWYYHQHHLHLGSPAPLFSQGRALVRRWLVADLIRSRSARHFLVGVR